MALPCTGGGPPVYLPPPSRRPGTGTAAARFPTARTDAPPGCLPVYLRC